MSYKGRLLTTTVKVAHTTMVLYHNLKRLCLACATLVFKYAVESMIPSYVALLSKISFTASCSGILLVVIFGNVQHSVTFWIMLKSPVFNMVTSWCYL